LRFGGVQPLCAQWKSFGRRTGLFGPSFFFMLKKSAAKQAVKAIMLRFN
jgi:hypothetical protein